MTETLAKSPYSCSADLHPSHWDKITAKDPFVLATNSGFEYRDEKYFFDFLGDGVCINPAERTITYLDRQDDVGFMRALVCVAYLGMALEADPAGEWVNFSQLPGGDSFFRGFHAIKTKNLELFFGECPSKIYPVSAGLCAQMSQGADAAVELHPLRRIPLKILVWGRTGEFEAKAMLLIDKRAYLHLPLDSLWALSNLVVEKLTQGAREV